MKSALLNLAREPFVNLRPIRRLTWLLWGLGALLLVINIVVYWRFFTGQGQRMDRLEDLEAGIERERAEISRLEQELEGLDIEELNEQAVFLNGRIWQRIFSWSELFDRLAEVLPDDVHLSRVSPSISWSGSADRARASTGSASESVYLGITGVAKSDTALLALVDKLFAHPSFVRPDLAREAKKSQQQFDFTLDVIYLPGRYRGPVPAVVAGATDLEADADRELDEPEAMDAFEGAGEELFEDELSPVPESEAASEATMEGEA